MGWPMSDDMIRGLFTGFLAGVLFFPTIAAMLLTVTRRCFSSHCHQKDGCPMMTSPTMWVVIESKMNGRITAHE